MDTEPTLTPAPMKGASGWCVRVRFPDGREKQITRFETQAAAQAWIDNESADWLSGMGWGN
jgi:hypothetical protein